MDLPEGNTQASGLAPPSGAEPLRVLLVEDHLIVREGLRRLLARDPGIAVVGEAANGTEALRLFLRLCDAPGVDVVVTDLALPDLDGAEVAQRVKAHRPSVHVLFLSTHEDTAYVAALLESGADGYVLKHGGGEELVMAVRAVANGETYVSPAIATRLVAYLRRRRDHEQQLERLTAREREILVLLATGETSKAIGRRLGLTVKTIENHRAHLLAKLGAANTAEAVSLAHRLGLLDTPPPAHDSKGTGR
jgi:DNA-binding NarL/FixJ family response regulator